MLNNLPDFRNLEKGHSLNRRRVTQLGVQLDIRQWWKFREARFDHHQAASWHAAGEGAVG